MFRRVEAKFAGPTAIGVLVPQGDRTLVVVRPLALKWDLLPARWDGDSESHPQFCSFSRDEAAGVARRFIEDLKKAREVGCFPVHSFGNEDIGDVGIWVRTSDLVWIACERNPNHPYKPASFTTFAESREAGNALGHYVHPPIGEEQEYYFNTQNFV